MCVCDLCDCRKKRLRVNDLLNHTRPEKPDLATQIKRYLVGEPVNNIGGGFVADYCHYRGWPLRLIAGTVL